MNFERIGMAELCSRIPYSPQTIYNLIHKKVLINGIHYTKPRGKLIFRWEAIEKWIGTDTQSTQEAMKSSQTKPIQPTLTSKTNNSLINI